MQRENKREREDRRGRERERKREKIKEQRERRSESERAQGDIEQGTTMGMECAITKKQRHTEKENEKIKFMIVQTKQAESEILVKIGFQEMMKEEERGENRQVKKRKDKQR